MQLYKTNIIHRINKIKLGWAGHSASRDDGNGTKTVELKAERHVETSLTVHCKMEGRLS